MTRLLTLAAALVLVGAPAAGADIERDRKARVALALAGGGAPAVATAPAPRAVVPKDYPAGHAKAVSDEKPLVVFVGCRGAHQVSGAVVSRVDEFGDVRGPAVVVGYPVGDRVWIHATLQCPVEQEELDAAVKAASKKINDPAPRAMPAPDPLTWDIRAEPSGCRCGEVCPCQAAKPAPVETPKPAPPAELHVSPDGTVNARGADGVYRPVPGAARQAPRATAPPAYLPAYPFGAPGCPGGNCPLPRR